jgi:protein O-GlcNAc transferase
LLHTLGVPELIAKDADDYRNRAIRLIRSPSHLTHLRSRLAQQRNSSPLFDMQRFAEGFANTLQSLR